MTNNYEEESETVGQKLQEAINTFDFSKTEYKPDTSKGRIGYFYFVPESFEKRIQPVKSKVAFPKTEVSEKPQ